MARFLQFAILMLLAACKQQMADQGRYEPLEQSAFFGDERSSRPLPAGTVARGFLNEDDHFFNARVDGELATTFPMPVTRDLVLRGRERYDIFCAPCHDYVGTGSGMVVQRGFRRPPPSFHSDRLAEAPPGHFYDVIANGFGAMSDYSTQIRPADRWAIVAYIRALQLSQNINVKELSSQDRQQLERAGR